jgi:hypothetical protein
MIIGYAKVTQGKIVPKVHAVGPGSALIRLTLFQGLRKIGNRFLPEPALGKRKSPFIEVPPAFPEKTPDLPVLLAVFEILRVRRRVTA